MCPHCSSPQQQPRSPSLPSPPGESAVQNKLTGGGCIRPARVFTGSDFCTNKVIQSWDFEKCAWMTWISGSTASVETCLHWQLNSETSRSERSRQTLKAVCNQKLGFALITLNFSDCWLQVILVFGDSNRVLVKEPIQLSTDGRLCLTVVLSSSSCTTERSQTWSPWSESPFQRQRDQ